MTLSTIPWRPRLSLGTSMQILRFVAVTVLKLSMGDNALMSLSLWRHVCAAEHMQNDRRNDRMEWNNYIRQVHNIIHVYLAEIAYSKIENYYTVSKIEP